MRRKLSDEHKQKISNAHKNRYQNGCVPWNKGKILSMEYRKKISEVRKGKKHSNTTRKKQSASAIGRKISDEQRKKISESNKNPSKETRQKMSNSHKGKILPEEIRQKMRAAWSKERKKEKSEQNKDKFKGEKNPAWQGGKSFELYTVNWTKDLKRAIRKRDKYICQICSKEPAIYVHHINYNKKNNNCDNLITLCHSCHSKTNHNRKYWQEVLMRKMIEIELEEL